MLYGGRAKYVKSVSAEIEGVTITHAKEFCHADPSQMWDAEVHQSQYMKFEVSDQKFKLMKVPR